MSVKTSRVHYGEVKIEVLHIVDCPSWVAVGDRLREALNATGIGATRIEYRLLQTREDAARVPFAGSPTILLDGVDMFPGGEKTTDLACRVYLTPAGLAGLPTTDQLVDALTDRGR
ncbi:MAG: alkylmercury lyase [Nonomuraea muscovyensis]|nr:alkylmercury lyase [Nonomuraea muscovyensis]